jgi:cytidylate kinase
MLNMSFLDFYMKVIAITGTNGSGKGVITDMLISRFNFKHQSARDLIYQKAKEQNLDISNRDDMREFANKYVSSGRHFISEFVRETNAISDEVYVIESIRRTVEIDKMREVLQDRLLVVAIDADLEVRYNRVSQIRKTEFDNVSLEEFVRQENLELENVDPNKQNIKKCIEMADLVITNNTDHANIEAQIDLLKEKHLHFFI